MEGDSVQDAVGFKAGEAEPRGEAPATNSTYPTAFCEEEMTWCSHAPNMLRTVAAQGMLASAKRGRLQRQGPSRKLFCRNRRGHLALDEGPGEHLGPLILGTPQGVHWEDTNSLAAARRAHLRSEERSGVNTVGK